MQDIAEKLKSFSSQAGDSIGKGLDTLKGKASQAGDYLQANPTIAAMLLAGGGAGLLGGYLTSRQPEEEGESKTSRRLRILRNALLAGGAGAGAVGLGAEGFKRLSQAVPEGSKNPVEEKLTSPAFRALGGAGAGAFGFSRGYAKDMDVKAEKARNFLNPKLQVQAKGMTPSEVISLAEGEGFIPKQRGFINPVVRQSVFLNKALKLLVGRTRAGQLARVGVAAGAFLPEIVGGTKDLLTSAVD